MRIMVFDVPAESGGALTILMEYYNRACPKSTDFYFNLLISCLPR